MKNCHSHSGLTNPPGNCAFDDSAVVAHSLIGLSFFLDTDVSSEDACDELFLLFVFFFLPVSNHTKAHHQPGRKLCQMCFLLFFSPAPPPPLSQFSACVTKCKQDGDCYALNSVAYGNKDQCTLHRVAAGSAHPDVTDDDVMGSACYYRKAEVFDKC